MPGPLSRPHFGEIDDKEPSDPPDITDAECQEPDDDEDTPADPDVVSMLGFDPDELFSGDEFDCSHSWIFILPSLDGCLDWL